MSTLNINNDYIHLNSASSDKVVVEGNLGIGTSSPATPLHVLGGTAGTGGWNKTATLAATYPGLIFNSNGTKWGGMAYDYSAAMRFWVNASNDDIFAGTAAMSILNNGNVGIGTTSPSEKLHVTGTILSDQDEARIRFNSTSGTGRAYDMIGGNDGKFYFYDRTATSFRYVIDSSGNVGIGTTSPGSMLHIGTYSVAGK